MSGVFLAGGAVAAMLASTLAAQSAPSAAESATAPPTEQIEISISTINGSGCRAGTAAVAPSEDNTAFTVTYSDYLASVGVGSTPTDFRKNCQLSLDVHIPQGFTYAVASVDYRGYAYLANGATGLEQAQYYYQGSSDTATSRTDFAGPYDDNWHTTDTRDYQELIWAPCGEDRNFNINTELRVYRGSSDITKTTSLMTMDSADGAVNTTYHLTWKEC